MSHTPFSRRISSSSRYGDLLKDWGGGGVKNSNSKAYLNLKGDPQAF